MNPDIYGDGFSRIEHFTRTTKQARPFRAVIQSTTRDYDNSANRIVGITAFTRGTGNTLYCLGNRYIAQTTPQIGKWNNNRWEGYSYLDNSGAVFDSFFFYLGNFYGLIGGTKMWRIEPPFVSNARDYKSITYTNAAPAIIHTKDGYVYLFTDNIVSRFDGTTLSTVLTLPANFIITQGWQNDDFINIVGYDSQTLNATCYVWNRDSSLSTLTEKYELYQERPYFGVNLGGTNFIITITNPSINSVGGGNNEQKLTIRYLSGTTVKIKDEFLFTSIGLRNTGCYVNEGKLYFNAVVTFKGGLTNDYVTFRLDELGNLTVAQNLAVITGNPVLYGLIRDGDNFFVATGDTGNCYNTTSTFPTDTLQSSFIETPWYSSDNFTEDIDVLGYALAFEPLPSGASVIVKTRADSETSWTPTATFNTQNSVDGAMTGTGLSTASMRQFRVESLGGAVITGWQVVFNGVKNKPFSYATK
jgi:hypothetical protein